MWFTSNWYQYATETIQRCDKRVKWQTFTSSGKVFRLCVAESLSHIEIAKCTCSLTKINSCWTPHVFWGLVGILSRWHVATDAQIFGVRRRPPTTVCVFVCVRLPGPTLEPFYLCCWVQRPRQTQKTLAGAAGTLQQTHEYQCGNPNSLVNSEEVCVAVW